MQDRRPIEFDDRGSGGQVTWHIVIPDEWVDNQTATVRATNIESGRSREFSLRRIQNLRTASSTEAPAAGKPASQPLWASGGFVVGERVEHRVFGAGQILEFSKWEPRLRVRVDFDTCGVKTLELSMSKLQKADRPLSGEGKA